MNASHPSRFLSALCRRVMVAAATAAIGLHGLSAGSIMETASEFQFLADLDGDGRADLVLLDKASGGFRVGYQFAPGAWTWTPARSSGIAGVTGVAVGKWLATDRDAFAVVSPVANRTHIVQAADPNALPQLTPVYGSTLGPASVASPDIGGMGNTVHADLWLVTVENGSPSPVRVNSLRHNGTTFTSLGDSARSRTPQSVRPMVLKDGGASLVAFMDRQAGQPDRFTAVSFAGGPLVEVVTANEPEGSAWASGKLAAGSLHHVLTWIPGATSFRSLPVNEGPPNVFSLGLASTHAVDMPIGHLSVVPSDAGNRLLVISEDASSALLYTFNGTNPPVLQQQVDLPEGVSITGVLPMGNNGFQLLSGPAGQEQSTLATPYSAVGGVFTAGTPQTIPALQAAALRANVFAFASEPFVNPGAVLLSRYNVADWTSGAALVGDQLSVTRERFQGIAAGLGSPATVSVGTVPVGTAFALTSQYGEAVSLHSFDSGDGALGPSVQILPAPGIRSQAVRLRFQASAVDAPVSFRLNDGEWTSWSNQEILIYEDTTVAYLVRHPITLQPSTIQYAQYTFEVPPHLVDSDDDGVPDFVEIGLSEITEPQIHLDPFGGVDSDGDGFSDLNEILRGTNPTLAGSRPSNDQRLDENNAFSMRVAPRPIDGTNGARAQVAQGNRMELFTLDGASLGGSAAAPLATPGVIGSGHAVDNVVADPRLGVVVMLTDPVFPIATVDPDKERGRLIAGMFLIPQGNPPQIDYTPGGGTLAEETMAWINAANAAYAAIERPMVAGNWHEIDTVIGLLLEAKIEEIFLARGLAGLEPGRLTLFGGRRGDAARFVPTADDLAALREQISLALPGHDIAQLFSSIRDTVLGGSGSNLRAAATAIYRLSSAAANAHPPGTYLPPFDVLRAFVRGQALPEPYASEISVTPATLAAAQTFVTATLAGLPSRPVESFTVVVEADSFEGACHRTTLLGSDHAVNLFAAVGQPYTPPIGFQLLAGTKLLVTGYTDVPGPCTGTNLELIDISVLEFPPAPLVDLNQNLLPDDFEWLFQLDDPYGDADGDGVSNLQELIDGTDPLDPNSKAEQVVDLSPPAVEIFLSMDDGVIVFWNYPPGYVDKFAWVLETSVDMVTWIPRPDIPVIEVEPGLYGLSFPEDIEGFYRISMVLLP